MEDEEKSANNSKKLCCVFPIWVFKVKLFLIKVADILNNSKHLLNSINVILEVE